MMCGLLSTFTFPSVAKACNTPKNLLESVTKTESPEGVLFPAGVDTGAPGVFTVSENIPVFCCRLKLPVRRDH